MEDYIKQAEEFDAHDVVEFARLLKKGRTLLQCELYDFAQEFNTGSGTISRWENCHAAPPVVARQTIIKRIIELIKFSKLFD